MGYEFDGHADYAEEGHDIVCAAVTAQLMMTYNGITMVQNLPCESTIDQEGGYFKFILNTEDDAKNASLLMETLYMGLKAIEIQYKDYITLKKEEV